VQNLSIIILCFVFIAINSVTSEARTIHVPGDYNNIRNAGRFAEGGDTILVEPGVYDEESILINTGFMNNPGPVILQGAGYKVTVIIGFVDFGGGKVKEPFKIDGFKIEGGINVESASITISNNFITKSPPDRFGFSGGGISLRYDSSYKIRVEENVIKDVQAGIACEGDGEKDELSIFIVNNMIKNNEIGISCHNTSPTVRGNRIVENEKGIDISVGNPDLGTRTDPGRNTIYSNTKYDIQHTTDGVINAKYNYWGDPQDPVKGGVKIINIQGAGWVDYDPWLSMDETRDLSVKPRKKLSSTWGQIKIGQR